MKTKAIEAIAMNCTVVSTEFGAMGLNKIACGDKLQTVQDHDWNAFTSMVLRMVPVESDTQSAFYDYYYWGKITEKVAAIIRDSHRLCH